MKSKIRHGALAALALALFSGGAVSGAEFQCSAAARVCFVLETPKSGVILVETAEACMQKCGKESETCNSTAGDNEISKQRCSVNYGQCAAKCSPQGGQPVEP
jgi:hypothetical protein